MKIAIASGKGGTGKTLVSSNLFYSLAKQGEKVTLVDCDAEEPNARLFFDGKLLKSSIVTQFAPVIDETKCNYCGRCSEYCNYNAIFIHKESETIKVIDDLCHGCGACIVACHYGAISEQERALGEVNIYQLLNDNRLVEARMKVGIYSSVPLITAAVKAAGDSDIILLDSPPGTSCPFIQTVEEADFVLLVTEPTPFGLSDLKQSVETLKIIQRPYGVVVNRADLGDKRVEEYLQQEGIRCFMSLPFSKTIAAIYSRGGVLSAEEPEWQPLFLDLFNQVKEYYEDYCL